MKILLIIFISISCGYGQYPQLKINERGKLTQDSTKYYFRKYDYYKDKLDAAIKKQNDNPYAAYDKKIFMYEDSCRRYKELIERKN